MSTYLLNICIGALVSTQGFAQTLPSDQPSDQEPIRETNKQYIELLTENYNSDINQTYWSNFNGGGLTWSNHGDDWDWERNQNLNKPLIFGLANLTADGGLRTPHWHDNADEYTIILQGQARVSVTKVPRVTNIDFSEGDYRSKDRKIASIPGTMRDTETFILNPGDAFYIPRGYSHFFESVDPDQYLYALAAFDTIDLSTFDAPQVMANFNPSIMARTFNIANASAYEDLGLYNGSRTVIDSPHPDFTNNPDDVTPDETEHKITGLFDTETMQPHPRDNGTTTSTNPQNQVDNFFVAYTEVAPGSWIEPYWVDNGDEYTYVLESSPSNVTMSIADQKRDESSDSTEFELKSGLMTLCTQGYTCTIQNDSNETLKLVRFYNTEKPSITQLYDSIVGLNKDSLATMFYTDIEGIDQFLENTGL